MARLLDPCMRVGEYNLGNVRLNVIEETQTTTLKCLCFEWMYLHLCFVESHVYQL